MNLRSLLNSILENDRLTRGLDDAEARMLVEWLVACAEKLHANQAVRAEAALAQICRRARAIARFVALWCHEGLPSAALQLAATERFDWPLPAEPMDPCELLESILEWEERRQLHA